MSHPVDAPSAPLTSTEAIARLRRVLAALPEGPSRTEAEDALEMLAGDTADDRLRMLLERAPDGVAVHRGARVLFANAALRAQLGYELSEIIGKPTLDFVHPDDRDVARARVRDAMVHGIAAPPRVERFIARDGSECMLEVASLPMPFEGAPAVVVFTRDVTSRLRAETQRAEALAAAERALAARDAIVEIVSHDLRSPLAAVRAGAEIIARSPTEARARASASVILRASDRMDRLITDLHDAAILDAGRLPLHRADIALAGVLDEAVDTLRPLAETHSLTLERPPCHEVTVSADRGRLIQVLTNLLGNAIRHARPGTPVVVRADDALTGVRVSVTDQGTGVSPEDLSRIFERYYRGARGGSGQGSGLGLYIARGIIAAHGGSIGVDTVPDGGSTFWFELPSGALAPE